MRHILLPLRSKSLKTINPVIIMNADPIPTSIWKQINRFPKVYFIQGSPLKLTDLEKVHISKALAIMILQKEQEVNELSGSGMVDADTIFIYKTVKLANPNIRIIAELADFQTMSFLSLSRKEYKSTAASRMNYLLNLPFSSGEVYFSTMLDTILCQAYYNPFITQILNQLLMGSTFLSSKEKKNHLQMHLEQSNLFLMKLPKQFQEKKFSQLFEQFTLEHRMIPIGIYRGIGVNHNKRPYVFLKPPADVQLQVQDQVYVLCPKQPQEFDPAVVEEEQRRKMFMKGQNINFAIKSKLEGEIGRMDTEQAREINKINIEFKKAIQNLNDIDENQFNKGLTDKNLIPKLRSIIRNELAKINKK